MMHRTFRSRNGHAQGPPQRAAPAAEQGIRAASALARPSSIHCRIQGFADASRDAEAGCGSRSRFFHVAFMEPELNVGGFRQQVGTAIRYRPALFHRSGGLGFSQAADRACIQAMMSRTRSTGR